jgi:hypothetical protein
MFKAEEKIARCKCECELTNLRAFPDTQTGTRFLTQRCETRSEIAVMLTDRDQGSSR